MNQTINISVPKSMMQDIKDLVEAGHFSTVSEVFRAGVNEIKLKLHPKYYKEVEIGPRAKRRLARAMREAKEGKVIEVKSFADLLS